MSISSIAAKIGCTPETLRSWVHRSEYTVVFRILLPPDRVLARLDWPDITGAAALIEALNDHWQCDVVSELAECCLDSEIPWIHKSRIAEILWSLAPDRYFDSGVLCHMLTAEVPELGRTEAEGMVSLLREDAPRFLNELLRLYHRTFLTPRFARATMVAAARPTLLSWK